MDENSIIKGGSAAEPKAKGEGAVEMTREDVERLVEETVAERLKLLRREADVRAAQARSEGRAEAQRLAQMRGDESAMREREERLSQREAELNRREMRAWVADALIARGLPRELEQVVTCDDMEACCAAVDALERAFREAVQRGVDERIGRGRALPRSDGDAQAGIVRRMRTAAGLGDK